ncbi:phosphoadenosine phosphosulfate reductase family protein [Legionella brunensis]|uniref:Phosphoadenosine phosphosulphate reductase domain-containing protein n=1 Tax=Legionella brunensis TaxID=29422 RepID=A0A0W0S1L4_9GAMM|nr:phosphoadenosine phosphosulfate reductase family protein [Legionella brunensis]KTC77005.1 hypothetical protein Lbru_3112 [Legionella brunensis]
MHVIIGNFGNHSLAAMQALLEKGLPDIHFFYVETGWAAISWPERVAACASYAKKQGINVHHLVAQTNFSEMVITRKQFPSRKFQWCASFLKGLTIINHLDECDPACEALIVSGKRQHDSRRYANLQEFEYENELYQGRTLWNPLWRAGNEEFRQLIQRTGFTPLQHPSLECNPCIHIDVKQVSCVDASSIKRLEELEQNIQQTMFQQPIRELYSLNNRQSEEGFGLQQFDLGCGAPWGCGE